MSYDLGNEGMGDSCEIGGANIVPDAADQDPDEDGVGVSSANQSSWTRRSSSRDGNCNRRCHAADCTSVVQMARAGEGKREPWGTALQREVNSSQNSAS